MKPMSETVATRPRLLTLNYPTWELANQGKSAALDKQDQSWCSKEEWDEVQQADKIKILRRANNTFDLILYGKVPVVVEKKEKK
jgi:hypothetical protein